MKAKKWLVIITGIISFLSLVCAYVFCDIVPSEFLKNFSFAILGSALLGMIMSLTEYYVARKQALLQYYLCAIDILKEIKKAKYFFMQEPLDLIQAYFLEKQDNQFKLISNKLEEKQARNKLLAYMSEKWKRTVDIPEPEFSEYAEAQFVDRVEQYEINSTKTMELYVTISKMDLRPLENAYGELDFFFMNKTMRRRIFRDIHSQLREYKQEIVRKAYHFQLYFTSESDNLAVLLSMIDEIQQKYFAVQTIDDRNYRITTIYEKFADGVEDEIERLRCDIYKQQFMKPEHYPCLEHHEMIERVNPSVIKK